ncbi:hypothetical protein BGW37DRAFT_235119 [Umbelopsis sp. PMI_123]|nr:hypothetical protein BGW37DRAFT_235119 [Umbelopsis sp. PMI_123]
MRYFYATVLRDGGCFKGMNLLYVDYGEDIISQSVPNAYETPKGANFLTMHAASFVDCYPNPQDVRNLGCHGNYWGLYIPILEDQPVWLRRLIAATRSAYYSLNASKVLPSMSSSNMNIEVILNRITATGITIQPTAQGARVLFYTVSMIMATSSNFSLYWL